MKKILNVLTLIMIANPVLSYAQGHSGAGGGDATASDFQNYVNNIDAYLLTEEGKTLFPEIKQPEFHEMAVKIKPVVKDERVYDSHGVAQTCVSYLDADQPYFQCDLQRLPKIELNSQPTFYRLTFHELLFQVGLELPISSTIPSDFSISSRLQLHLERIEAWRPGVATVNAKKSFTSSDFKEAEKCYVYFSKGWSPAYEYMPKYEDLGLGYDGWKHKYAYFGKLSLERCQGIALDVKRLTLPAGKDLDTKYLYQSSNFKASGSL